ncbi:MAG: ABC transporter ATP-binding protein/permease [Symbiobacteriaceae bacterium]|nr:ABC transporter ATP-binding protein/permease [Symbiobacteriaceae bacterium]
MSSSSTPRSPSYTFYGNISFVCSYLWRWGKAVFPLALISCLSEVAVPFIAIFLPKLVIDALSGGVASLELVKIISVITLLLVLLEVSKLASNRFIYFEALANRIRFVQMLEGKSMTMDYAIAEDPAGQRAKQKAYEALNGNHSGAEAVIVNLVNLLAHSTGLILYAGVVAALEIRIILLLMVGGAISIGAVRWAQSFEASRRDDLAENSRKRRYLYRSVNDYTNAKDIRLYTMAPWLDSIMGNLVDLEDAIRRSISKRYLAADTVECAVALLRDFMAYTFLINLVLQNQIAVGDFTLLFAAIAGISGWISKITIDINLLLAASLELGFYRNFLNLQDNPRQLADHPPQVSKTPEIVLENLSYRYPGSEQWTLRNLNLRINPGEKLALVGINGAGKTTLVKLLTGLYSPTEGRILIDGHDAQSFTKEQLFQLFAPVFQEARVLAMDVGRNIALIVPEEVDANRVWNCLELAGLQEHVETLNSGIQTPLTRALDSAGVDLSGGQAQKLMLARALYKDAPIVIMDEPTAALDALAEETLYLRYNDMVGAKTSLYISHRLASTRFCHRIAFLQGGQITELGTHQELMALGGTYAEMFAVQAHYYQEDVAVGSLEIAQIAASLSGGGS